MNAVIRPLIIALLAMPLAIRADEGTGSGTSSDPVLQQARTAVARQDFGAAAAILRAALAKAPANPEYHNLYAYALRKGANPNMDVVFEHYLEALRLDPRHRGAHEYLGEAYLLVGDVQRAREQLTQLDRLCFFGCEEYSDLKKAIAEYEARTKR
jgi:cytochrome c-type biogenesis protein CcmH/NrfG